MSIALTGTLPQRRPLNAAISWKHPIVLIGLFLQAMALVLCPLTPFVRVPQSVPTLLFMVSPIFWLAIVHVRFKPFVQVPQAVIWLLVLEVWSVLDAVIVGGQIGKDFQIDDQMLMFGNYACIYLVSATLVALTPNTRKIVFGFLFAFIFISTTLGALQFAHVGFAVKIQDLQFKTYAAVRDLGQESVGVRASGFSIAQSIFGIYASIGFIFLASQLRSRLLRWWEWALVVLCGFGILACQTRSVVFPWVLSLGVFTIIVIARYKSKGIAGVLIVSLAACAVLAARAKSFGYVFTKHIVATDTLDFRKNVAWPQLYPIFKQFPLTGIGPDWRFTYYRFSKTSRTALSADKFVRWGSFDGSYHHLLATLGIVGVVIFAFVILTALAGSMKVALDRAESAERRNLAIATFMMICTLLVIFATFEDMWWKESMWPVLIALGLASRTRAETIHYMGRAGQTATETAWRRVLGVFTGQAPAKLKV